MSALLAWVERCPIPSEKQIGIYGFWLSALPDFFLIYLHTKSFDMKKVYYLNPEPFDPFLVGNAVHPLYKLYCNN